MKKTKSSKSVAATSIIFSNGAQIHVNCDLKTIEKFIQDIRKESKKKTFLEESKSDKHYLRIKEGMEQYVLSLDYYDVESIIFMQEIMYS